MTGPVTWPVFVINIAGNPARMARVAADLDRLGIAFTRIEAVDGRALIPADLARVYDPQASRRRARRPLIGPEIGCYLSHISIWQRIAAGDAPGGIILEDDFAAADDLPAVLTALAADPGGWEIAKLFSARVGQTLIDPRPLVPGRQIAVPYKVPNTTLGYAIRKDAAPRLRARALPVSRPIDEDHKHFWELGLRVSMVAPPPLALSADSTDGGSITEPRQRAKPRHDGGRSGMVFIRCCIGCAIWSTCTGPE
jgi:glycosyl transferase family 25